MGRVRTVSDNLDVKGTYILDMFLKYQENTLFVNRKYQRKLVWTLDEKKDFINTILNNYPVPIFLLVKNKPQGSDQYQYDVIDGLQRLDAIISYVRNEFSAKSVDGKEYYFNISALGDADEIAKQEGITPKSVVLGFNTSRRFLNYQLPVATTEVPPEDVIDIFKRINSTGRKLSKQDLRQAGVVGDFADLVRKTSSYVRGDITESDVVRFRDMPNISLSNKGLKYQVNIFDSFWLKHGILTMNNIRISRDEELIARLFGYILLGDGVSSSSETVTSFYTEGSRYYQQLEELVRERTIDSLMRLFSEIYSDINRIFGAVGSTFGEWMFTDCEVSGKAKVFQVLFLSLFELRMDNYYISNYKNIAGVINGIGDSEFPEITTKKEWNRAVRNKNIRRLKSILQPEMIRRIPAKPVGEWEDELNKILSAYGIEQQMYDFKMGSVTLRTGSKNEKCISKIVKSLTAMANTQPEKTGTVVLGIADKLDDAKSFKQHYKKGWVEYKECYITGLNEEIKRYWGNNPEEYINFIRHVVENEPVRDEVRDQILRDMHLIEYQDRMLLVISLKNFGYAIAYDKKFFDRHGSNLHEIETGSQEFDELIDRCNKRKGRL